MNTKTFSTHHIFLMVGLGIFFYVYEYLLRILPGVLVHEYMHQWHFESPQIGLIDSAYYWAYTPMQPFVGAIVDRFGVRPTLILSVLCCAFGCLLFQREECFSLLVMGRFLIGLGSSFAFISVLKIASVWLEPRYTNFVAGLTTAMGKAFAYGGIMLMTVMVGRLGSDELLYGLFAVGMVLFLGVFFYVHDRPELNEHPEDQPTILEGIWKAFRSPQIWLIGFVGGSLYLHTMVFSNLWGIVFLQKLYGYSNEVAAQTASITFLGWAMGGPIAGYLVTRFGHRRLWITTSCLLSTVIFSVIIYLPIPDLSVQNILTFALGFCSSPQILIFPLARDCVGIRYAGSAMAMTNMVVMIGGFLGLVIGRMIESDPHNIELMRQALMIVPITTAIAFFMSFLLEDKDV